MLKQMGAGVFIRRFLLLCVALIHLASVWDVDIRSGIMQ